MTLASVSTISTTMGRSNDSRMILAVCNRLERPNLMAPRSTVAPARCSSRAFNTTAS